MSTPAFPNPPGLNAKKGKGPLFWILIGIGSLALVGILIVGSIAFFGYRMMQNAGISAEDFKNNPALAAARIAVAANPDLEILSEDQDDQSITVRQKSTGETMTMRMNPDTGAFEMETDKGSFRVDGKSGQMRIEGENGETAVIGSGVDAKLPAWLPAYPGTDPKPSASIRTPDGESLSIAFKTSDSGQKVMDFYEERLKGDGFTINSRTSLPTGGMLIAEDGAKKRTAIITMGAEGEVMIQTQDKN